MKARKKKLLVGSAVVGVGALVIYLATRGPKYSYGGPNTSRLNRDPTLLLPSFAARLNTLFARMRALGWHPMLHEGYRTPARALELSKTGAGIADSMHTYGAAVDIFDEVYGWSAPAFFDDLGREAEALGLTWGGRFGDDNHIQAVSVQEQARLRATTTRAEANAFVLDVLAA